MAIQTQACRSRAAACILALAGALTPVGAGAHAAGLALPEAGFLPAQFQPYDDRGYGRDRPGRDGYGRDGYGRDGYGRDDYGRDRYRDEEPRGRRAYREDRGGGGPGGSYQRTCSQVRQGGSSLSAVCRDGRGGAVESTIDLSQCGGSDIANVGGYLRCGNVQGRGGRVR